MLETTDRPTAPVPIAAGAMVPRRLLIAEPETPWPALAEDWRKYGAQVSVLIQRAAEPEPAFVRRLCAAIASAQLEGQPFEGAALVMADDTGAHVQAARERTLQLLAQSLLRAARPIALQVHCPSGASAAFWRSLERVQRAIAREFRDGAQFIVCAPRAA